MESMIKDDGILYLVTGKVVNNKKRSQSTEKSEEEQKQLTENKTVAMYKHVGEEGLHITVDPATKELTSKPSKKIIELMKTGATVKDLIEIGVFVKVEASEAPVAKKPKIEPKVEAEPVAKLISSPA